MKNILATVLVLVSGIAFGQTDSVKAEEINPGYKPLLTLTHDDIRRLPVSNFMELVNTAFPMLTGNPPEVKDYSFFVNGFISVNPNAINIAQIGRIDFYPNGSFESQGSLSKNGSFVITLLQTEVKNAFGFSTRSGMVFYNKDSYLIIPGSGMAYKYHGAWFSLNELSFLNQNKRSTVNSTFSYTKDNRPFKLGSSDNFNFNFDRFRLANYFSYGINDKLRISGNLLLSSFNRTQELQVDNTNGKYESEWDINTKHAHASAALDIKPNTRFSNRFSMEGNLYRYKNLSKDKETGTLSTRSSYDSLRTNVDYFVITNEADYNLHSSNEMKFDAGLLVRYRNFADTTMRAEYSITPPFSYWSWIRNSKYRYQTVSVAPSLSMLWREFVKVYASGVLEKYSVGADASSLSRFVFYPEISLSAEFAGLIKQKGLASLNMFASYRIYFTQDEQKQDLLDILESGYYTTYNNSYASAKRFHAGAGAGIMKNRLNLRFSFLRDQRTVQTGVSFPETFLLHRTGWSSEISARIFDKDRRSWKIDALVMTNKYKTEHANSSQQDNRRRWGNMVRTRAGIGNIFFQGSVLLSINQQHYDTSGRLQYHNDYDMNYLLIGYRRQLKNFYFTNLEISAQSKNLILPKYPSTYGYASRYIGIGISLFR
jgi:hypothetical protein